MVDRSRSLRVVCVRMRNQLVASYQLQKISDVQQKEDRTEDRSLWNPMHDW